MNPFCCIRTIRDVSTFSFIGPVLWYLLIAALTLEGIPAFNFSEIPYDRYLRIIVVFFLVLIHAISMWMLSKTLQLCVGASTILSLLLSTFINMPMVISITLLLLLFVEPEFVAFTYILVAFGVWLTTWILKKCTVWTLHRCSFYFKIFNDAAKSVI